MSLLRPGVIKQHKTKPNFSHSSRSLVALKENQLKNWIEQPLVPIQDVPTRWNSQYLMANRLVKLRLPIFSVLMDGSVTKQSERVNLDLPESAWKLLENILPVLKPLAATTEILTAESSPTLSQVNIPLKSLVAKLQVKEEDTVAVKELKSKIVSGLRKRFQLQEEGLPSNLTSTSVTAMFLDPRYKSLRMLSAEESRKVKECIQGLLGVEEERTEDKAKCEEEEESDCMFECLKGDVDIDLTNSPSHDSEIEAYQLEAVRTADPFLWWKTNETR